MVCAGINAINNGSHDFCIPTRVSREYESWEKEKLFEEESGSYVLHYLLPSCVNMVMV